MAINDIIEEIESDTQIQMIKKTFILDVSESDNRLHISIGCKNAQGRVEDNYSFESNEEGFIHPGQVITQLATAWDIAKKVGKDDVEKSK